MSLRFIVPRAAVSSVLAAVAVAWSGAVVRGQRPDATPGNEVSELMRERGLPPAQAAPPRAEGEGPFDRLVLRGATVIDGTGAPPQGPVDIVIAGDRILEVRSVGSPGTEIAASRRPAPGDREIDAHEMFVLPGFIDSHAHISHPGQGAAGTAAPAEYVFKLWMGHGITSIREPGSMNGLDWTLEHKRRSAANEITAPRIYAYAVYPNKDVLDLPLDEVRPWVRAVAAAGADGIKFLNVRPEPLRTALDEASKLGLRTTFHHAQMSVARMNVLDTARWGLTSMEHWYGLPEALFEDQTVQSYPTDYNYNNEQHRFGEAGRLWRQAAPPGSDRWHEVMDELVALDFTLSPTLTIYEAARDAMRARRADWHDEYTWPSLWQFFQADRDAHGSFFFNWTTADEIAWKENYRLWMAFLNAFKNKGGRVVTGSDSGFIYKIYGFGYIRELELLQEAGFHPLEVIRAATLNGAELLGAQEEIGTVETGKLADLIVVEENPLANFKVLYGTGALRLNDQSGELERVGGVRWTIKDGIVYDARQLRADVRRMVRDERNRDGAATAGD